MPTDRFNGISSNNDEFNRKVAKVRAQLERGVILPEEALAKLKGA